MIRANPLGDTLWTKIYSNGHGIAYSCDKVPDGGFVIAGMANGKASLLKIDSLGNPIWIKLFSHPNGVSFNNYIYSVLTINNGFAATGCFGPRIPDAKALFILKTDDNGNITQVINKADPPTSDELVLEQNYPNPFNPLTKINYRIEKEDYVDLSVYNFLGEKIITLVQGIQTAGKYSVDLNIHSPGNNITSGIYFYILKYNSGTTSKKMVVLK